MQQPLHSAGSDSEEDYAPIRTTSRALQRTATEHSLATRIAPEHSPATREERDPEIRLQKSKTLNDVRVLTHHNRLPDVGIGILVFIPKICPT